MNSMRNHNSPISFSSLATLERIRILVRNVGDKLYLASNVALGYIGGYVLSFWQYEFMVYTLSAFNFLDHFILHIYIYIFVTIIKIYKYK